MYYVTRELFCPVLYKIKNKIEQYNSGTTIIRAATHETEIGDHDFCLIRSHYTDTDSTSREWVRMATAGIEPGNSSPGGDRFVD